MELRRIDNLWKFLGIKNNLPVIHSLEDGINYRFVKGGLELVHHFNPKFLHHSSLRLEERGFQENLSCHHYTANKLRFGFKPKIASPVSKVIFFPKELLSLHSKFDLEIHKDRNGHFKVVISPFSPKNIYEILDAANLISRNLWKKNFFAEGIRN